MVRIVVPADKNLVTNQVIFADKTIFDIFGHYNNYMHLHRYFSQTINTILKMNQVQFIYFYNLRYNLRIMYRFPIQNAIFLLSFFLVMPGASEVGMLDT